MTHNHEDYIHFLEEQEKVLRARYGRPPSAAFLQTTLMIMKEIIEPILHDGDRTMQEIYKDFFDDCDDTVEIAKTAIELFTASMLTNSIDYQPALPACTYFHQLIEFYEIQLSGFVN